MAQVAGDTITVQAFDYTQTTYGQGNRTKMVQFPNISGMSYERILMLYNMRCKGGVVGNLVPPSGTQGCGEWDYSCNTYVTDSSRVDSVKATHPSHIIPGFSGSSFPGSTQPTYTYYDYGQTQVTYTSTISENEAIVGTGTQTTTYPFHTQTPSGKSQYLWLASELTTAGLQAGNITGLRMNVSNAGSNAQFLRIKIKSVSASALSASTPDLTGFTEVYHLNTSFTNGIQQFNFHTPFNWNGTDALLVEFSYTNTGTGSSTVLLSDNTTFQSGLNAEGDYHYNFNGGNHFTLNNPNWNTISSEISFSFWSNGNPDILPANTSILHAHNNAGTREMNIHHPWSNANIYWDCGNSTGYDRINAADTSHQYKNGWKHWTFTKNSTTGIMNIFLNGSLWLTGANKNLPPSITNLKLGSGANSDHIYFGKMDEFTVWKTALDSTDIQQWMRKSITSQHPQYANLLSYYSFNEGSGTLCSDQYALTNSAVNGGIWNGYKGQELFKGFIETNNRPWVTFVQGVYTQTTNSITVRDSVINTPYTVYSFSTNGYAIAPIDTQLYYKAGYTYVYDGSTNLIIDSVLNTTSNPIAITTLNYFQYSPARYQIMSFVTPYGNGLDLGPAGKTWTFDVTDFAPILKGNKLMTMDAGGQWQEDMDVKFLFLVGTPPRDVMDIKNIWRVDAPNYQSIMSNQSYEPRSIALPATASSFKIRSAITGHGQEGEFIPRNHYININGGTPEFTWDVWKTCGDNPVHPQGGTWIYDRTGWCPGMATDVKEMSLNGIVAAGSVASFDYGIDTATGDSRYWVSNQLVSYGAPNHTLDVALLEIKNPSQRVEYAKLNPICTHPTLTIRNNGSTPITSLTIEYWVNNNSVHQMYNWTGNLAFMETAEVIIPSTDSLWQGLMANDNVFHAELKNPNSGTDGYVYNNKMSSAFKLPISLPGKLVIMFRANGAPQESSYKITNEAGTVVYSKNTFTANTIHNDTLDLSMGCYTFQIDDTDGDGISFWANSDGTGFCRLKNTSGNTILVLQPDFGNSIRVNFTVNHPLAIPVTTANETEFLAYPNPAHDQINIEIPTSLLDTKGYVEIFNAWGVQVAKLEQNKKLLQVNTSDWPAGLYMIRVNNVVRKVVVE